MELQSGSKEALLAQIDTSLGRLEVPRCQGGVHYLEGYYLGASQISIRRIPALPEQLGRVTVRWLSGKLHMCEEGKRAGCNGLQA